MLDSNQDEVDAKLNQVRGEYLEMPGLQLTVAQTSRLCDMKPATTVRVLNHLVESKFLRRQGDCYVRSDCGRMCA